MLSTRPNQPNETWIGVQSKRRRVTMNQRLNDRAISRLSQQLRKDREPVGIRNKPIEQPVRNFPKKHSA